MKILIVLICSAAPLVANAQGNSNFGIGGQLAEITNPLAEKYSLEELEWISRSAEGFHALLNGDFVAYAATLAEDVTTTIPSLELVVQGREPTMAVLTGLFMALTESHISDEVVVLDGNTLIVSYTIEAMHTGTPLFPGTPLEVPAQGNMIKMPVTDTLVYDEDRMLIRGITSEFDIMSMLAQARGEAMATAVEAMSWGQIKALK